ncbi:hypothetical protein FHG87_016415 [Trinorchestia longiramus]|nr:hypothetical protein FHG87_016415 [Trinorchestia longiramus]
MNGDAGLERVIKLFFIKGFSDHISVDLKRIPNAWKLEISELIAQARILTANQLGGVAAVTVGEAVRERQSKTGSGQFRGQCFRCEGPHMIRNCNEQVIVVKGRMPVVTKAVVSDRLVDGVDVVLGTDVIDRLDGVTVKRGKVEFGSARVEMAFPVIEQATKKEEMQGQFGMDNANSVATPVDVNADLVTTSDEVEECDKDLYQSAVDADWAGDRSDRKSVKFWSCYKSTSGYCFTLSNSVIIWRSVKQSCVALSTAEAEYVVLAGAAQKAIWLKQLLDDLEFKTGGPMVVNEDNQSAICLAQNPKYHGRSKHIDIKFHYVRDLVRNKEIDLVYCPSNDMLADIFTKGLSAEKFSRLRSMLGVVSFEKHIQCEKEC